MATSDTQRTNGAQTVAALPAAFYDDFLSASAKERKPSAIRSLFPLEKQPGVISLLAGKPNASTFPFTSLSFTAQAPAADAHGTGDLTLTLDAADLARALQYGDTAGQRELLEWVSELQARNHGRRAGEGWRVSIGSGSQDLISKAVAALVNPGDAVLVESPVYAGVIPMFQSLHCNMVEVETDAEGIQSASLRAILESWPAGTPKPRVLYTVPYGCNPTGMTATLHRRKEVLALAREHNFLILEDDPYFYLYYGDAPRYPSYFALEREAGGAVGRVLRFDSLSKILSAGIRIGFASGPVPLLNAIDMHTATANLQTSSLTQALVAKLLGAWGHDGFAAHVARVAAFYRAKRDVFARAMERHLEGLAEWAEPEAGMFFWFKLFSGTPDADSRALIERRAFAHGVLALPGTAFLPNGRATPYVRAAFSLAEAGEVDEALRRLRGAILEERAEGGVGEK